MVLGGCGHGLGSGGSGPDGPSSVTIAMGGGGGSFDGNSVQICGQRPPPDSKYRCESVLHASDGSICPCFDFAPDGSLLDPMTGQPVVLDNLCPSSDFPEADWTFTYAVFSEQGCRGTQLNDGNHNFTCFDSRDLVAQANPNASVEPLDPGANVNHILCITVNASKEFNFESCAVATTSSDAAACLFRLDCGCVPTGSWGCECGPNGVGPGDLPPGCAFDPATCDIVCANPKKR